MSYSIEVELAKRFATNAHHNQKDKAGEAYIQHPERVASRTPDSEGKVVAWLHDTVEDTDVQISDIENIFGTETAQAVDAITRKQDEKWEDYLLRVKANEVARRVKINDLIDNSNLSRLKRITFADVLRQQKYNSALLLLVEKDQEI